MTKGLVYRNEWTRMHDNVKAGQNPDELFDVVDEQDRVLRSMPRREVHAQGLLHRAVHVLIFNDAGELFLQQRSMGKDCEPGKWSASCSGHVDAGEDYDTAIVRELQEELGLTLPKAPERWLRFRASEETGNEFTWVYRAKSNGPITMNPAEIMDGGWFNVDNVRDGVLNSPEDFSATFRFIWNRVAEEL
jgi:isopentenyl-diphosphate delta-isomerase type 1